MSELSQDDYQDLFNQNEKIKVELNELENQGWDKKKDRIKKYVDNSRLLLNAGKLDIIKKDFAQFLYTELSKYTSISRNGDFYKLFSDDELDARGAKSIDTKAIEISSGLKTTTEIFNKSNTKTKKDDKITKHFSTTIHNANEAISLIESLTDKYNESDELSKVMIEELGDIDKLIEKDLEIAKVLSLARKQIDDRNKWGNYEKLVAQFLIAVGETKAELAKKLNYCSKYASIGIERNEELTRYWEFLGKCPSCKIDVHNFFDLQIEKYLKGEELGIETPLKGY